MDKWLKELTLEGNSVRLEPMSLDHTNDLTQAVKDGNLWELWYTSAPNPENVGAYISKALQE
ncbi:hypothetical protein [Algoriphagus aquimarinus]|uniref:hypothetical protein n=1 Tax=Algoriphagus aquimarinus TaxID=237018 RepID=UPI001CB937F8|nr:hypothetical protein [Algoriphagus aquimarinus]